MKLHGYIVLIFGIVSAVGGIIGFTTAGSIPSLAAGILTGAILGVGSMGIIRTRMWGVYLSLLVSIILAVFFGLRFSQSMKLMPAGIMLVLSLAVMGFLVYALAQKRGGNS